MIEPLSKCFYCGNDRSLRQCLRRGDWVCRICCKEEHEYTLCDGCSYRVWTPDKGIPDHNLQGIFARNNANNRIFKNFLAQEPNLKPLCIHPLPFLEQDGTVYVMRSKKDPQLVKIGFTRGTAKQRLKEFKPNCPRVRKDGGADNTSYFYQLNLEVELEVCAGKLVEKLAHTFLERLGRRVLSEVFKCSKEEIEILFKKYQKI